MPTHMYLIRYGQVPEVARFRCELDAPLARMTPVVVTTHRGLQLGTTLEAVTTHAEVAPDFEVVRVATAADLAAGRAWQSQCEAEFERWQRHILEWELDLELIDLEWTLDGSKQILYVLTERGPATTNLALQAAAAGLGVIEVQPVSAEGLVSLPNSGGGCGSGGCGCSH